MTYDPHDSLPEGRQMNDRMYKALLAIYESTGEPPTDAQITTICGAPYDSYGRCPRPYDGWAGKIWGRPSFRSYVVAKARETNNNLPEQAE